MLLPRQKPHTFARPIIGLSLGVVIMVIFLTLLYMESKTLAGGSGGPAENIRPIIDSMVIATSTGGPAITSFDLIENATSSLYIHGSYTDDNGCVDVSTSGTAYVEAFRSSIGALCQTDDRNCYTSSSLYYTCDFITALSDSCDGGSDVTAAYECEVGIQFFADATDSGEYSSQDWWGYVSVSDYYASSSVATSSIELNTLSAVNAIGDILYGQLDLGTNSTNTVALDLTNLGNKSEVDILLSGIDMVCTDGSIDISNQRFATSSQLAYDAMTEITTASVEVDINIPKVTSTAYTPTSTIYFRLLMPVSGVSGSCNGTVTILGQ